MTIVNGKVFEGDVVTVNGRIVFGKTVDTSQFIEFDETKKETVRGINRIVINSNVNVNISTSSTKEVVAHLYGSCSQEESNIDFSIKKRGSEVCITAKLDSSFENNISISGNSVTINEVGGNRVVFNLTLDIELPAKVFDQIFVKSKDANVNIDSNVKTKDIVVFQKYGNVNIEADAELITVNWEYGKVFVGSSFKSLKAFGQYGNIKIESDMHSDVKLDVKCKYGNANVVLLNLAYSNVSVDAKFGTCKNIPKFNGRYTVTGCISSKYGNVKFH